MSANWFIGSTIIEYMIFYWYVLYTDLVAILQKQQDRVHFYCTSGLVIGLLMPKIEYVHCIIFLCTTLRCQLNEQGQINEQGGFLLNTFVCLCVCFFLHVSFVPIKRVYTSIWHPRVYTNKILITYNVLWCNELIHYFSLEPFSWNEG